MPPSSEVLPPNEGPLLLPTTSSQGEPQEMMSYWTSKRRPTRGDWDRQRLTIKRLYMDEQKALHEVVNIMATELDFHATVRMYKSRLQKWRLDKNNKEREILAIVRKKRERDVLGKRSAFEIRGRQVDLEDALRYCRRKGREIRASTSPSPSGPPTPSNISCWTPPSSSPPSPSSIVPHSITPPASLLVPELLLACIRSYLCCSISNRTWISGPSGELLNSQAHRSVQRDPGDVVAQCSNVAGFFKKKSFVECRQAMSQVFAMIQDLLIAEHPRTLESFLASLFCLTQLGIQDITSMLRSYISQMAQAVLPNHHPLREVCCMIGLADADDFELLLDRSYHCVVDSFEHELGPFHKRVVSCRVECIHTLYTQNDTPGAERQLRKTLSGCKEFCGASDWRSQYIMVSLGWNLNHQGRYAEAEAIGLYALQCATPDSSDSTTIIRRLELIGDCQYHQAKMHAAEGSIRDTIDIIGRSRGRADPWAVENMIRLEKWLRGWGREDEAAKLMIDIKNLLDSKS